MTQETQPPLELNDSSLETKETPPSSPTSPESEAPKTLTDEDAFAVALAEGNGEAEILAQEPESESEQKAESEPKAESDQEPEQEPEQQADPVTEEAKSLKLGDAATQRFRELSAKAKRADEFDAYCQQIGATEEQLASAFAYITLLNRGDQKSLEQFYEAMSRELSVVAQKLGREAPGVDPIAGYDDIKQRLEDGRLEREDALELARARAASKLSEERQRLEQQAREAAKVKISAALAQLDEIGNRLSSTDPLFPQKFQLIKSKIPDIKANYPPELWPNQLLIEYAMLKVPEAPRPAVRHQPLRPTGGAPAIPTPKNDEEAFFSALG